jgi:chromosome segregation ATPase
VDVRYALQEIKRLRAELEQTVSRETVIATEQERDEARAEIERLRAEIERLRAEIERSGPSATTTTRQGRSDMSKLHRQREDWDAAMMSLPVMYCGRLDMATWNASTGERQKMVYFDGEEERVICEGRLADFVAYAANRYQPLCDEVVRLRQKCCDMNTEIERLRASEGLMSLAIAQHERDDARAEIERLRADLDSETKWAKTYMEKTLALEAEIERLREELEDRERRLKMNIYDSH